MVLWACAPGVALVADDVVVVDVDVDVAVLLSEPQPTSARLSARAVVAAVKCFIYCISQKLGRYLRQPRNETSRVSVERCSSACGLWRSDHLVVGSPPYHRPADDYGYPAGEHPIQQNRRHTHCRTSHVNRHLFAPASGEPDFQARRPVLVRDRRRDQPEGTARQVWRVLLAGRATTIASEVQLNIIAERLLGPARDPEPPRPLLWP